MPNPETIPCVGQPGVPGGSGCDANEEDTCCFVPAMCDTWSCTVGHLLANAANIACSGPACGYIDGNTCCTNSTIAAADNTTDTDTGGDGDGDGDGDDSLIEANESMEADAESSATKAADAVGADSHSGISPQGIATPGIQFGFNQLTPHGPPSELQRRVSQHMDHGLGHAAWLGSA